METVNAYLFSSLRRNAGERMQILRDRTWTYAETAREIHGVAEALRAQGIGPGDRVAVIAENSPRWFHVLGGVLALGAVLVPRGTDIGDDELAFILEHSGSKVAFAGTRKVAGRLPADLPRIGMDDDEAFPKALDVDEEQLRAYEDNAKPEDLAVILYTSGTTGQPKGVMLEHRNIAHNLRVLPPLVNIEKGDLWVSILPSWHTFELTVELAGYCVGCLTIYSDKRRLRDDLRSWRPQYFASVPRIWETIHKGARDAIAKKGKLLNALFRAAYAGTRAWKKGNPLGLPLHLLGKALFYEKIAAATGGRLKYAISGGGYLPPHVDEFFNGIGVTLLVGYGLTETAPVVAIRYPDANIIGTIGRAVPETELRLGPEGTLQVKGPQVMRGYYKDEETTRAVLSDDGWFDTGDLVKLSKDGDITFVGRAKETIVLSGGENIEPEPIENALLESDAILQVMLVGQDKKTLAALIVRDLEYPTTDDEMLEILRERTGKSGGFRSFEAVNRFAAVDEPFSIENGLLTPTLKMRRNLIAARHAPLIEKLYGA